DKLVTGVQTCALPIFFPGHMGVASDPDRYVLVSPGLARSTNEGTFKDFMSSRDTPFSYTLEYPMPRDLETTRSWNLRIVDSILEIGRASCRGRGEVRG